jgi:DNA-nicking Smr family endonuclease
MAKSLDLHGVKHSDAERVVDNFIGGHIVSGTREVEIITGFSVRMKEIVNDIVTEYNCTAEEDFMNGGKLIISLV